MVSKEQVGLRIRTVRVTQRKTLKEVEALSGFSSTHISEIERGRTSPTIGALIRIAGALEKDPSYFIEDRELDELCVTSVDERPNLAASFKLQGTGGRLDTLTKGILGGRLLAYELILEAGGDATFEGLPESGDLLLYSLSGQVELTLDQEKQLFEAGDGLHLPVEESALSLHNQGGQESRILLILDPREAV
jgi:transcriptional regulator with XRE-family HTH domain